MMYGLYFFDMYIEKIVFESLRTKLKETKIGGVKENLRPEPNLLSEAARDTHLGIQLVHWPS